MVYKSTDKKLITVNSSGVISELGGINGPILNPFYATIETINTMVTRHRNVYEVNPKNYKERVLLTISNYRKQNFTVSAPVTTVKSTESKISNIPVDNKKETVTTDKTVVERVDSATEMVVDKVEETSEEPPIQTFKKDDRRGDFKKK